MIPRRLFLSLLMFAALLFLFGCQTPLVDVDVKGCCGGSGPPPGPGASCYPPWWACPATLDEDEEWMIDEVYIISNNLSIYELKIGENRRSVFVPPAVATKDLKKGDAVKIKILEDSGKLSITRKE